MTPKNIPTQQIYPKRHLLAASGIAALLCLTLLVYPSREVEAKKTFINIELEAQSLEEVTEPLEDSESIETQTLTSVASEAETEAFEYKKDLTVKSGETLSVLFERAGLGNSLLHSILSSSKEAKRFTQLKVGQTVSFEFDENKQLKTLSSQINTLESIHLEKQADSENFVFRKMSHKRKPAKNMLKEASKALFLLQPRKPMCLMV